MPDPIELTLVLRPPEAAKDISEELLSGTYDPNSTTPGDLTADSSDVQAVKDFAAKNNLTVVKSNPETRSIKVSGSAADIQKAFGIEGGTPHEGSVESLDYKGPMNLPESIRPAVLAVLGLDQTPIAKHHTP